MTIDVSYFTQEIYELRLPRGTIDPLASDDTIRLQARDAESLYYKLRDELRRRGAIEE